jgi:hypothetical protein
MQAVLPRGLHSFPICPGLPSQGSALMSSQLFLKNKKQTDAAFYFIKMKLRKFHFSAFLFAI